MDNSWAIVDFCPWRKLLPAQSTALFLFELDSFFLYPRKKEVGQRSIIVSLHFRIPFFDVSICQIPSDLQVSRHRLFPLFCFYAFDVLFVKKADLQHGIFPRMYATDIPWHSWWVHWLAILPSFFAKNWNTPIAFSLSRIKLGRKGETKWAFIFKGPFSNPRRSTICRQCIGCVVWWPGPFTIEPTTKAIMLKFSQILKETSYSFGDLFCRRCSSYTE